MGRVPEAAGGLTVHRDCQLISREQRRPRAHFHRWCATCPQARARAIIAPLPFAQERGFFVLEPWPQASSRCRFGRTLPPCKCASLSGYHLTSTVHCDGPVDFDVAVYGLPASDAALPVANCCWPFREAVAPVTLPSAIVSASFPSVPKYTTVEPWSADDAAIQEEHGVGSVPFPMILPVETPQLIGPDFDATTIVANRDPMAFAIAKRLGRPSQPTV